MKSRPIVIFAPDPPPDLSRARLAMQFAAGFACGAILAMLLMPLFSQRQLAPGKAVTELIIFVGEP
jgi:hypothetical protein